MARDYGNLISPSPTAIAPASVHIAHVQLRDLIICPRERGVVNYIQNEAIVEQNLYAKDAPVRTLATPKFSPNSLTFLPVGPNDSDTLLAAGGQDAELHLSYLTPLSSRSNRTRLAWESETKLLGSINNSVLLTSLSLAKSHESSLEPRVGVSNNDFTFKLYDIPLRVQNSRRKLVEVGQVRFDVPINHSSISPDGRTLISVGDSNKIYFHRISGSSSRIDFTPVTNLTLPPPVFPSNSLYSYPASSLAASFSTAFCRDGSKFAVASQEGVVAVWDVRSTRPVRVFQTDKTRLPEYIREGNGGASGWVYDDPWEWTRGTRAPGWCVRSVKFNGGGGARGGREVMTFTEHTNLVHVVDALTFEQDEILRVPTIHRPPAKPRPNTHSSSPTSSRPSRLRNTPISDLSPMTQAGGVVSDNSSPSGAGIRLAFPRRRINLLDGGAQSDSSTLPTAPSLNTSLGAQTSTQNEPMSGASRTLRRRLAPRLGDRPSPGASSRGTARTDVLEALRDTFRIELRPPSTGPASSVSNSPTPPTIVPTAPGPHSRSTSLPTMPLSSPTWSSSSGGTSRSMTYSPPASIGDSTWRTLGGAWPVRRDSTEVIGSTSAAGGSQVTSPPGAFQEDPEVLVIPPLGDREVVQALLARLGSESGSPRRTATTASNSALASPSPFSTGGNAIPSPSSSQSNADEVGVQMSDDAFVALLVDHMGHDQPGGAHDEFDEDAESDQFHIVDWGRDGDERRSLGHDYRNPWNNIPHMLSPRQSSEDRDEQDDPNTGSTHGNYHYPLRGRSSRGSFSDRLRWLRDMDVDDDGILLEEQEEDLDALGHYNADHDYMDVDDERRNDDDDDDEDLDDDPPRRRRIRDSVSSCTSSADNSRSGSPTRTSGEGAGPSASGRRVATGTPESARLERSRRTGVALNGFTPLPVPFTDSRSTSSSSKAFGKAAYSRAHHPYYTLGEEGLYGYQDDLDIAGVCFDPTGERMYVANCFPLKRDRHNMYGGYYAHPPGVEAEEEPRVGAVVEWEIQGADKRWYVDEGWR